MDGAAHAESRAGRNLPVSPSSRHPTKAGHVTKRKGWRTRARAGNLRTLVCTGRSAVTRAGDVSRGSGGRIRSHHHADNRRWPSESLQRSTGIHLPARRGGSINRNRRPRIFGGRWSLCSLGANLGRVMVGAPAFMRGEEHFSADNAKSRRSPRGEVRAQTGPCRPARRGI
jgi:hypothetical protein